MKRILIVLIALLLLTSLGSAATLTVGKTSSYKYHTIQSAVDVSHTGDTILVANGSYPELVNFKKVQYGTNNPLKIQGAMVNGKYVYPRVYGFQWGYDGEGAEINGFKMTKYGVDIDYGGLAHIVRNNYFENCGITLYGPIAIDSTIINNQFTNGSVHVGQDSWNVLITGCTFNKCNPGVYISDLGHAIVKKNKFNTCKLGVRVGEGGAGNITNNTFKYCDVGIRLEEAGSAYMNWNTYTGCKTKVQKVAA